MSKPRRARPRGCREEWMARLRERVRPPFALQTRPADHIRRLRRRQPRRRQRGWIDATTPSRVNLQPDDYEEHDRQIVRVAASCGAKVVSVLEGGYGHLSGNPAEGAAGLVREGLAACVGTMRRCWRLARDPRRGENFKPRALAERHLRRFAKVCRSCRTHSRCDIVSNYTRRAFVVRASRFVHSRSSASSSSRK